MIRIETPRLRIFPLTLPQLEKLIAGTPELEAELGLAPSGQELDAHTREAMQSIADLARETPDSFRGSPTGKSSTGRRTPPSAAPVL